MYDYEKLGVFYLGRQHDLASGVTSRADVLYDSKDLTTHAVIIGMTGSGKTGLGLTLLEEAAIDGIPAIVIDPKGDLGNLLLTFPELKPANFRPWIEDAEAIRNGLSPDEFAAALAKRWRDGLAEWDQPNERIQRFREAADVAIYTPGSNAGLPLTALRSFDAPPESIRSDADALRERVSAAASGLLALMGVQGDPIRSPEHILLSNLLDRAWQAGKGLDIPSLIRDIQKPPFDKVGFLDLETFFPAKDRFDLSMRLNNLVASPSFAAWMQGEPLDVKRLLYTPQGKPRLSIISIAHLADAERMFFVTILLNEMLSWMRSQPGTSSLRAILYMDEVFGYFPPSANPPSKTPMLTLLKQARAFGLGCILATQNPVDLDYKGLANAGTWFIGRLQTERDKARVLDGLEGCAAATGSHFDRQKLEATLSQLGQRVFLLNNIHDDQPTIFKTRFTLSYLRGPLTRTEIAKLMLERKQELATTAEAPLTPRELVSVSAQATRPILPPEAGERFVSPLRDVPAGAKLVYCPALLGRAKMHFAKSTCGVDIWRTFVVLKRLQGDSLDGLWDGAETLGDSHDLDLSPQVPETGEFAALPAAFTNAGKYKQFQKAFQDWLYREQTFSVFSCPALKAYSAVDEEEDEFRVRLTQSAREKRDLQVEKLKKQYAPKLATLQDRIRRAEEKVEREKSQYNQGMLASAISIGTTVLGALLGNKMVSATNISKAGTSIRSVSKAANEKADIGRAEENVEVLREKLAELEADLQSQVDTLEDAVRAEDLELETISIPPKKSDTTIDAVSVIWLPCAVNSRGETEPLW